MISVVVLTRDEEANLPTCLASVDWSDDVVVFDSGSRDQTQAIARSWGVRVEQRSFDDFASHRNAALHSIAYKNPWVLMLDADERVPSNLAAEMKACVASVGEDCALYRVRRRDYFQGQWLRRSTGYPTWFARLMRPQRVEVRRAVNEEYCANGLDVRLRCHLEHFPFNKGMAHWIAKHNDYSSSEAVIAVRERLEPSNLLGLANLDATARRRALKALAYRLPFRPALTFLYLYLLRAGFIDGRKGLEYVRLRVWYEWLIDLKIREIERRSRGLAM